MASEERQEAVHGHVLGASLLSAQGRHLVLLQQAEDASQGPRDWSPFPSPTSPHPLALPPPDPDFIGQTDLAGASCKMTIEAAHRFGIEIACQSGGGVVIQLNAESHADQKHWSPPTPTPSGLTLLQPHRYDAIMEHIEIANDAVLRAQGLANDGMKSWYEQKLAEQRAAVSSLQKGRKLVRISSLLLICNSSAHQRKHYIALGFHRMHDRLICVRSPHLPPPPLTLSSQLDETGKILLWCDPYASPSDHGDLTPTNSFPLADIISVKLGRPTLSSSLTSSSQVQKLRHSLPSHRPQNPQRSAFPLSPQRSPTISNVTHGIREMTLSLC